MMNLKRPLSQPSDHSSTKPAPKKRKQTPIAPIAPAAPTVPADPTRSIDRARSLTPVRPTTPTPASKLCKQFLTISKPRLLDGTTTILLPMLETLAVRLLQEDKALKALDPNSRTLSEAQAAVKASSKILPVVMFGVVGDTGAGKSSLINALLDYEQIAPASGFGGACTTVPTEFLASISSNKTVASKVATPKFRAEVRYITLREFICEATILLQEAAPVYLHLDAEQKKENKRATAAWSKLCTVFPDMERQTLVADGETFELETALETLRHMARDRVSVWGSRETITANSEEEFSRKVKMVVANEGREPLDEADCGEKGDEDEDEDEEGDGESNTESKRRANDRERDDNEDDDQEVEEEEEGSDDGNDEVVLWPLIKDFRVYLHSEILDSGVVLVDLPGQRDANPARNQVADDYISKCDGVLVIMETRRAVDNKTGDNFLKQRLKQQLDMDGLTNNLAIVCTKTDDLKAAVARRETTGIKKDLQEVDAKLKDMETQKKEIIKGLKGAEKGLKKPINDWFEEEQLLQHENELLKKRATIEAEISKLLVHREWIAINKRNNAVRSKLSKKVQQHLSPASSPSIPKDVPIFTVSSQEYQYFQNRYNSGASEKFLNEADTQIPTLRDYCINFAVTARTKAARAFFHGSVEPIVKSLELLDRLDYYDMTDVVREQVTKLMDSSFHELQEKIQQQTTETTKEITKCISLIIEAAKKAEKPIYEKAQELVNEWGTQRSKKGIFYVTLRALAIRKGEFRDLDLNYQLIESMIAAINEPWTDSMHKKCPEFVRQWAESCQDLIKAFHSKFIENAGRLSGRFRQQLETVEPRVHVTAEKIVKKASVSIQRKFKNGSKTIHRAIATHLKTTLQEAYVKMGEEVGKGAYKRMIIILHKAVSDPDIFSACRAQLSKKLEKLGAEVTSSLQVSSNKSLKDLRGIYSLLLREKKTIDADKVKLGKEKVKELFDYTLNGLERAIKESPEENREEREDEEEESEEEDEEEEQ